MDCNDFKNICGYLVDLHLTFKRKHVKYIVYRLIARIDVIMNCQWYVYWLMTREIFIIEALIAKCTHVCKLLLNKQVTVKSGRQKFT